MTAGDAERPGTTGSYPVGVIGAGTMGVGIAAVLAASGHRVTIVEPDPGQRDAAAVRSAALVVELGGFGNTTIVQAVDALGDCRIVIEAAAEAPDIKRAIYRDLFAILPQDAIVASNTSSIPPDELAIDLPDEQARRFLVAHFWNAPHRLPLVELVPGTRTGRAVIEQLSDLLAAAALRPVTLTRAVPGFIGNRLQFALLREALHLVEAGVATPAEIDEVMRFSLGRRWAVVGPFEAADLGGLHIFDAVAKRLMPDLAHGQEGAELLAAMVAQGRTGARTGQGFYDWSDERRETVAARAITIVGDHA